MIPDFRTYIGESVWANIHRRSNGTQERKEDDVNHMNFDTLAEYIKDTYSEKGVWFSVVEGPTNSSRHIEIEIISGITLSFNEVDGKIYNILIQSCNKYVDVPGLKKIFNVNILGSSTFSVVEKDWTKSNNTFVKLIEFFLKKKTNESVWADMHRRSNGGQERKEDSLDNMSLQGFYDYWRKRYNVIGKTGGAWKDMKCMNHPFKKEHIFSTPIEYTHNDVFVYTYCIEMSYDYRVEEIKELRITYFSSFILEYPDFRDVFGPEYNVDDSGYISIVNGEYKFHHYIDIIDKCINMVKKPYVEITMNESVWADMHRRSNGEIVRKEDDVNHLGYEEFFVYLTEHYKPKSRKINEGIGGRTSIIDINVIEIFIPIESIDGKIKTLLIMISKMDGKMISAETSPTLFDKYVNLEKILGNKYTIKALKPGFRVSLKPDINPTNRDCVDLIDTFINVVDNPILEKIS